MSELLMLKTINNDYVLKGVKTVERYCETHKVNIIVLICDDGVVVYDDQVLLLRINVSIEQ